MSPREGVERGELHRRLVWVTVFRLVVITVLLAATAVLTFTERDTLTGPVQSLLYGLTVAVYLISIAYLLMLRQGAGRSIGLIAWAQVVGDVAMATFLVWLTGGGESVFAFLYTLAIINAAIVLRRRGTFFVSGLSSLAYIGITVAMQERWVLPPALYLLPAVVPLPRLVFNLAINAGAFFVVAVLASWLAEQVRRTGERLSSAEESFAALSALHEQIVESVASGILTLDPDGRITFVNRFGRGLFDARLRDVRGRPLREVLPTLWEAIVRAAEVGQGLRGEAEVAAPDGQKYIGFSVSPLGDHLGQVVVFQDLTAMRHMEQQVQRNERLAALGVVAAGLAHEIRNPLASMSGSIELLRATLPAGADEARLMGIVLRETERLERLISDFLLFARPAPPRMAPVPVRRIVELTWEVFRNDPHAAGCELELRIPDSLWVRGDEEQLRQILLNLFLNAAQAMAGSGRIVVRGRREGGEVHLSVCDSGPGMDEETARRIFDPFFTTRPKGTGLGLATVHRLVEAHGGRIHVDSAPGEGCCVTVVLQTARAERSTHAANAG